MMPCPLGMAGCNASDVALNFDGMDLCRSCVDFIAAHFTVPVDRDRQAAVAPSASPSCGVAAADRVEFADDIGGIDDCMKSEIASMRQSVPQAATPVISKLQPEL